MLEQRMQSWRVFPVEEAKLVQSFLAHASEAVEEEEGEEDMTAEELLLKLEKLEVGWGGREEGRRVGRITRRDRPPSPLRLFQTYFPSPLQ